MTDISRHFTTFNFQSLISNSKYSVKENKHLSIAKYNHNTKPDIADDDYEYSNMFCRGVIVNTETNKIICLPTPKSCSDTQLNGVFESVRGEENIRLEPLLDGTMINIFYNIEDSDWEISTRTVIGADCRWNSDKTFRDMFFEILENDCQEKSQFFNQFSKDTSYSFVMMHVDNRIVTPVIKNELILVDAYKLEFVNNVNKVYKVDIQDFYIDLYRKARQNESHIYGFEINSMLKHDIIKSDNKETLYNDFLKLIENNSSSFNLYSNKGFALKIGEYRFNFKNPLYERVKFLKGNSPKKLFTYVEQRHNGTLTEYLKYFKESLHDYSHYREKIHIMTQELYDYYCSTFKQKTTSLKEDVPYQLKPLCYELHGNYLETKKPVHFKMIKDYVNKLPPQRLYFVLKFYFTYTKPESELEPEPEPENTHIRFKYGDELEEGASIEQP